MGEPTNLSRRRQQCCLVRCRPDARIQLVRPGSVGRLFSDKSVSKADILGVLRIYDTIRRPFGNGVVERARSTGFLYEFNNVPPEIDVRKARQGSMEELKKLGDEIQKKWEIMYGTLPDVQWQKAQSLLREMKRRPARELSTHL